MVITGKHDSNAGVNDGCDANTGRPDPSNDARNTELNVPRW